MSDDNNHHEEPQKAVALGYDREHDEAPRIVASGKGHVARQIIAIAEENGVYVRKDKDLVEILSHLEVDSIIPLEAYAAVAEILSYIYRVNAGLKEQEQTNGTPSGSGN